MIYVFTYGLKTIKGDSGTSWALLPFSVFKRLPAARQRSILWSGKERINMKKLFAFGMAAAMTLSGCLRQRCFQRCTV